MKVTIDTEAQVVLCDRDGVIEEFGLYSKTVFELLSHLWLKVGWNQKYPYTFSWMGRPIIQIPEDMVRMQEAVWRVRPDVVVETGVAHGGSLVFYASLLAALGRGRAIGVDIEIRAHNRAAIEAHPLFSRVTLIEGNSVATETVDRVRALIQPCETVMVVLDSNHCKKHVLAELEAYHSLVTPGSYIVATDGSMRDLYDVPRGKPEWIWDNPVAAVEEFVRAHPGFEIEQPSWPFNESELSENITHWPRAWLRRTG